MKCVLAEASIADAADRRRILDAAMDAWGRIDLLVNNAGVGVKVRGDLLESDESDFDRVVAINCRGPLGSHWPSDRRSKRCATTSPRRASIAADTQGTSLGAAASR